MRELYNAFVRTAEPQRPRNAPKNYRELCRLVPEVLSRAGASSVLEARVFEDLSLLAAAIRRKRVQS